MTKGIVEAVSEKIVNTKNGAKPTYSIKVPEGWFNCGFKKPSCNKGDEIEFEFTSTTYGNAIQMPTLKVVGHAVSSSPAPVSSAGKPFYGNKGVFPIPALDGQRSIIRQNALTNARELYSTACAMSGSKVMVDFERASLDIIKLARHFEAYTAGDIDRQGAEEAVKKELAKARVATRGPAEDTIIPGEDE